MAQSRPANRLARSTSPYLLQHANNPVDWYQWNEEALASARAQDKPILLSIGYAACHWCHVMAHESFEDAATAELMNRLFVNIKVDREERPDLDRIYQLSHQLLTQRSGGWPLTLFIDPQDMTPFYAGTYFPREARYGMPAFREILQAVADAFHNRRDELRKQNSAVRKALDRIATGDQAKAQQLSKTLPSDALTEFIAAFDKHHGGFGPAPKFPHVSALEFLLQQTRNPDLGDSLRTQSFQMLLHSLGCMSKGGLFDHLGGGFCRYSVDDRWQIPHFEKMLYDNAGLLGVYAEAAKLTNDADLACTAVLTGEWVLNEMQAPGGGFYSSLDADSEGHEGRFYLWTPEQVKTYLDPREYRLFAAAYGLDAKANFEGYWHLWRCRQTTELSRMAGIPQTEVTAILEHSRKKLLAARNKRVRPECDDKQLTAWNGLMIRALADAGRWLNRPDWLQAAISAAQFVRQHLYVDGRLLASYRNGTAQYAAYLDDHAFLLEALLALLQVRWNAGDLTFARELADTLLMQFEDREHGGFWFTANDHESLIHRPKSFTDDAMVAGNAAAARGLARLGHLLAEPAFLDAATRTVKAATAGIKQYPLAHAGMLTAAQQQLTEPVTVVIRGAASKLKAWREAVETAGNSDWFVLSIPQQANGLDGLLAECRPRGECCAYICKGTKCSPPVTSMEELSTLLGGGQG